jgi:hypothetical protein
MLECGNGTSVSWVGEQAEKYDEKKRSARKQSEESKGQRRKKTREKTHEQERHSSYALRHTLPSYSDAPLPTSTKS